MPRTLIKDALSATGVVNVKVDVEDDSANPSRVIRCEKQRHCRNVFFFHHSL